jgi:outer membrane protein OmpA-like peptidoglycan-associated protein
MESFQYNPGTTQLTAPALDGMDILARILKAFPSVRIKLIGHPSAEGDTSQQRADGLRRATSAKSLLVERGVDPPRIDVDVAETEPKDGRLELAVTKL